MTLAAGARVGGYEVIALLGQGGMGEVYRARDTTLGREMAIKTLAGGFANDAERVARFAREARVLAALNHPHIGAIYGVESGTAATPPALVLELVEGETLEERLERSALPLAMALDLARQIADAIDFAHERGVIHRDLKPANIKITPDGRAKVLDFGIAKALGDDSPEGGPTSTRTAVTRQGVAMRRDSTSAFSTWEIPAPLPGVARKLLDDSMLGARWSPDGRRLTFIRAGASAGDALWVADADGGPRPHHPWHR